MKAPSRDRTLAAIYAAAVLSLVYLLLGRFLPSLASSPAVRAEMGQAAQLMARASAAVRDCRAGRGFAIDIAADPNGTGLIGEERTEITTSAGRLEAKRTTTNPAFAALVVSLLYEAGVREGDAVAVGASSSFPALVVATLAAAKVVGVEPLVISSLGASEWGGNIPGYSWLEMEACLNEKGLIDVRPIARAIGGEEDIGRDMSPEGRSLLAARIRDGGAPFLEEPDLERNVARRMALYRESAGARPIKAFINIGGSWANLGTDSAVLKVEPGLSRRVPLPPPDRRGVIQAMAAAGIPVIHLLNVKGLCERYGLPWDPRPLPAPGEGPFYRRAAAGSRPDTLLTAVYVLAMLVLLATIRRRL
ncbi:MAG: poly-gamma-glutamate system protein [Candidatus Aminicenantes bacterium]|nr:MAG: poly-gamma-glutamate system protein [Candidatus Aminicenantes bacterium]